MTTDVDNPQQTNGSRRRDLLMTLVMVGIVATPGWLLPGTWGSMWQLVTFGIGVPAVLLSWQHAPWVPTPHTEQARLVDALQIRPHERFCDLGAGDGRIVAWIHSATGADCTGIEASPLPFVVGWLRVAWQTRGRARMRWADLYTTDLSAFDVFYVWGTAYSVGTQRFADLLAPALRRGARVVAYGTPVFGIPPARVDRDGIRPLFLYGGTHMTGLLVALEGIDGGGKSTQITALATLFTEAGLRVITTKEPTEGPHGQAIRSSAVEGRLDIDQELALFEADRRQHVEQLIAPEIAAGSMVLVDRYYYSTAAYQGIRGKDPAEIIARNETFAPRPDLLVVVDLPAEVGLKRVRGRDEQEDLFEALDDLRRCRDIFRANQGDHVLHVDGLQTPQAVTEQIVAALLTGPLQHRTSTDLSQLAAAPQPGDPQWRAALAQALRAGSGE